MTPKNEGWEPLRRQSETLRRKLRELLDGSTKRVRDAPGDSIAAAQSISRELAAWEGDLENASAVVRDLLRQIEPRARQQAEQFDTHLSREIAGRGFAIYGDGASLMVEGMVHVETDAARLRAVVNGVVCPQFTPAFIAETIGAQIVHLRKELTPPEKMLQQLATAYDREIKASSQTPGTQVTTESIMLQLALLRQSVAFRSDPRSRNFRDYPREQFRADLFALLESGRSEVGAHRLRYAAGSDKSGAVFMLVPSMQRTVHLGRLWFEEVGS